VELKDCHLPGFVLFDAALDHGGWMGYIYEGQSICLPQGGQVNMIALEGCYTNKVDFMLTGGGRNDARAERKYPFFSLRYSGYAPDGSINGKRGFEIDVKYTVTAIPDNDPTRMLQRSFTFKNCPETRRITRSVLYRLEYRRAPMKHKFSLI